LLEFDRLFIFTKRGEVFLVSSDIDRCEVSGHRAVVSIAGLLYLPRLALREGIPVSEYAWFGAAQIALERSRRRRGRRMPALGAPTSRFVPPPPRAPTPVIGSFHVLVQIL